MTRSNDLEPLSSQGIANWMDYAGGPAYRRAPTESHLSTDFYFRHYAGMRGLVWVRLGSDGELSDVNTLASLLDQLRHPIVLVTTDGDCSVPSGLNPESVQAILEHPLVVRWYTQNHEGTSSDKIRGIPIGLDLHSLSDRQLNSKEKLLQGLALTRHKALPVDRRPHQIACDIHLNTNSDARVEALRALHHCPHLEFIAGRVPQGAIWRFYASFALALSTHGRGLDCHRTWEQLKLGCIVVTKSSPLDPLYQGLPVAIVEDWSECNDRARLERWVKKLSPLTERAYIDEKLSCGTWVRRMRAELDGMISD